jgi:hypothetical protein
MKSAAVLMAVLLTILRFTQGVGVILSLTLAFLSCLSILMAISTAKARKIGRTELSFCLM